ncbi:MAG: tetratricopeptide repeat protein [Coleofasciculus sp. G3-WIS-01]|uniref:tetratricopeptide repeat protein n=1 Tax=Coleofasciculus sp. G3-WIS-01 TaxID=3069528 RepID=UPI0032F7C111
MVKQRFIVPILQPKSLKYLGWAISVTLMTLLLNLTISPTVATVTEVETTTPNSPVIDALTVTTSQLVQQGKKDYQMGHYAAAITFWKQALETFTTQGDILNQAMVLSNLALAYRQLGQWHEANQAIETSLNLISTQNQDTSQNTLKILAQALNTQGHLQLAQGQAESALATWEQATKTYQQVGDETGVTRSLINQTQAMRALGLYLRARNLLDQIRQTLAAQPDSLTKIVGLRSLGDLLCITGDLNQSRQILEQSLAIAKTLPSPPNITAILFSLGNTARSQHQIEDAIQFYQQAAATTLSPTLQFQAQANQLSLLVETQQQQTASQLWTQLQPLPGEKEVSQAHLKQAREVIESLQLAELDNFFQEACLSSQPQQIDHIDPTAAVFYPIILPDRLEVILSLPGQPLRHYVTQASSVQVEDIINQMRQSLRPTSLKKSV